ncbi:hypothetical protein K9O30_18375 [Clostridium bowmanii]|uniref:Ig-like domain-containing protein n=1 Tax=Clostridium bowmanii TaxID=132925 RepID=UPI001C0C4A16|nr:Ig-like domain-containing protein [Clostridium bowmanii]MBU3191205.1 hypothetical protein [Clostridium bowmanii]MCA1075653.1 hypothetical protein [Clostridium bowmanii]
MKKIFRLLFTISFLIICLSSNTFAASAIVEAATSLPKLFIDTPTDGVTIKTSETPLSIDGWALDPSGIKSVQVYIDNIYSGDAILGISRPDVNTAFPGYIDGATSGFNYTLDISSFSKGNHTITVNSIGMSGEVLSQELQITIALPSRAFIDTPTDGLTIKTSETSLSIDGWALDPSGIKTVKVYIDNIYFGDATLGISRQDVDSAFPGYIGGATSGFNYTLDISKLSKATHTITVNSIGVSGEVLSQDIMITLNLPSRSFIDTPADGLTIPASETTLSIDGWALDPSGIKSVQVYIDNTHDGDATLGISRPDVNTAFPGYVGGATSGFSYTFDISSLSGGNHTITVNSIGVSGDVLSQNIIITTNLSSKAFIDNPTDGSTITTSETPLSINGWALAPSEIKNVQVYVDNIYSGDATLGIERPDVFAAFPGYVGGATSGFSYALDISTLSMGNHTISINSNGVNGEVLSQTCIINYNVPTDPLITKIFNSPASDTSVIFDCSQFESVFLKVTKSYDTLIYVHGEISPGVYTSDPLPLINLNTGNSLNFVSTSGVYSIDTKQFKNIKFMNINGWNGKSNLTASVYIQDPSQGQPVQIIGDYNNAAPTPTVLNTIASLGKLLAVKDGKSYSVVGNIIYRSDNWGVDEFSTNVCTIIGATDVYKMLILDNGNVLVWDRGGKIFLSTDNFATFNEVFDMLNSPTHDLFGAKAYKNYVMFTQYSNTIGAATKAYISEDYGVTIRECFDIVKQDGSIGDGTTKFHTHDCAIDPYELNSDGMPMLWVSTGDGMDAQMIFFSKDMGATWTKSSTNGDAPTQITQIIPLKNCVLFLSDSRIVSVLRYDRPTTKTKTQQNLSFETAFLIQPGWGKDANTEVPIGCTAAIDFENSKAYFGFSLVANASSGNVTNDALLKGQVYATDGYKFYEIYKNDSLVAGSGVTAVYGVDSDNDKSIVARIDGINSIRLSAKMWD